MKAVRKCLELNELNHEEAKNLNNEELKEVNGEGVQAFETHAIGVATSDVSTHQIVVPDEACDPEGSDDNEQDVASNDAIVSNILSAEVFDSEDAPFLDNFIETKVRIAKRSKHIPRDDDGAYGDVKTQAFGTDVSVSSSHQFIDPDVARGATSSDDNVQDDVATTIAVMTTAVTQAVMPAIMGSVDKRMDLLMDAMERMEEHNRVLEGRINMFEEWVISEEGG